MEDQKHISRRAVIRSFLYGTAGLSLACLGGTLYSTKAEPEWLKVERLRVPIQGLPPPFNDYRIVQLSDLHYTDARSGKRIHRAIDMALDLQPDLLLITGDYVTGHVDSAGLHGMLERLSALDGVWVIMGNHDHWTDVDAVRQVVSDAGLRELRNAHTRIEREGAGFWLAGVDDIWERHHDLIAALDGIPPGEATILMAHEPDYADEVYPLGRVSLQLSGHSHGGQVRIPFFADPPVLPYLGEKYPSGLRRLGEMWLYTSRGVGTLVDVRFNCRPEVTEIGLVSGEATPG